jgi:hypothetical protein
MDAITSLDLTRRELLLLDLVLVTSEDHITCVRHPETYRAVHAKVHAALLARVDADAVCHEPPAGA